MTDYNNTNDSLTEAEFDDGKVPQGINILTILTFIWCSISLISSGWGFFSAKKSFESKDKLIEQMSSAKMPSWAKAFMPNMENFEMMVTKSYENRIPILLLSVIGIVLCFVGAMQMRKRKKQGYLFYVIGELLPFLTLAFFVGFFALSGAGFFIGALIAGLFIFLYTMQRKHLIY
jgi:hypothetical protein